LDENFPPGLVPLLVEAGHDVSTISEEGLSGCSDETVFRVGGSENRTIVTLDLDFSNPIRFPTKGTAGVIVLRIRRPLLSLIEDTVRAAIPQLSENGVRGKLWILEPGRIREYDPDDESES
jgi:predicted nuclease of predicted toxin-antitoxin system